MAHKIKIKLIKIEQIYGYFYGSVYRVFRKRQFPRILGRI